MSDRIEEIRVRHAGMTATHNAMGGDGPRNHRDRGILLDALATRDAEIERLKAAGDVMHRHLLEFHSIIDDEPMTARIQSALTQWKEAQS